MGGIDVATVVGSIISAFGSGLDIFHRLGGKKRKSNARLPRPGEEEEWLRHSLTNRPLEIRAEFDQNVAKLGHRYEVGDSAAHSSLAHTLVILNTGLVNIINHALSRDAKTTSASRKALFSLSETAAMDTMTALGQLHSRLSLASQPRLPIEAKKENRKLDEKHRHHSKSSGSPEAKKPQRPPPQPLLVRGGWVRPKSGSSVVSVVSGAEARKARQRMSEKDEKDGRPQKHQRSKSDSAVLKHIASQPDQSLAQRGGGMFEASGCTCGGSQHEEPKHSTRRKSSEHPRPQRQPSMYIVPADFFDTPQETIEVPPPRPPKIPLHSRPNPRTKARPTSTMTFVTTSTKVGEIPESRWPDRVLSAEEMEATRMPYTIPPALEESEPKKKTKGFKFWKREDKRREVAAY